MTDPPHGGPPPGEPGRPGAQPPPWPSQPWGQQPGPWGPPASGPYGGRPPPGQQPWGGPPPYRPEAPPRRSRRGLVAGIVVPAVLLVIAIVLARLLGDTVLDTGAVEQDVAEQFEEIEGVAIDLTCDDEMQVEQGADYECTGRTADDEEITLRIVITDEDTAAYTWEEV